MAHSIRSLQQHTGSNSVSRETSSWKGFQKQGANLKGNAGLESQVSNSGPMHSEGKEHAKTEKHAPGTEDKSPDQSSTNVRKRGGDVKSNSASFAQDPTNSTDHEGNGVKGNIDEQGSKKRDDQGLPLPKPDHTVPDENEYADLFNRVWRRGKKDDDGRQRKRRRFHRTEKKTDGIIEGAHVGESRTQDMFIPSKVDAARMSGAGGVDRTRSVIEQMKEFQMGDNSLAIYHTVSANVEGKEESGVGASMQKALFTDFVKLTTEVDDIYSKKYKIMVRDIVQGSLKAAKRLDLGLKEVTKIIMTGLMHVSPHGDDPDTMADLIGIIASEMLYAKVNIGIGMKLTSNNLGAAAFTLIKYFESQPDFQFNKQLKNYFTEAFSNAIWDATGQLTNFSQTQANANIEQFISGRVNEEREFQGKYIKSTLLSPLKKVEDNKFVRGIMDKFSR